jgi:hypothetical protein
LRLQTKSVEVDDEDEEGDAVVEAVLEEDAAAVFGVDCDGVDDFPDLCLLATSFSTIMLDRLAGSTIRAWGYWR